VIETLSHTADVRLRITAPTLEELFAEGVRGMAEQLDARRGAGEVRRGIVLESADRTALLVDFLNEVLAFSFVDGAVFDRVEIRSLTETAIDADVIGTEATLCDEIKAVTYHEADVRQRDDGAWTTILVFDI
jgi:SHS2 domain-containing protein